MILDAAETVLGLFGTSINHYSHKFKDDISGHVYAPLIEESLQGGIDSGVEGTPTFYINEVRYEDSWDLETFSETIKRHLTTQ